MGLTKVNLICILLSIPKIHQLRITMEGSTIVLFVLVAILWLGAGIAATRELNNIDGDATDWSSSPLLFKVVTVLLGPIFIIIFERHIFSGKK